ncbi:MAG TPA: isoleucine--tRNA ligase, partial [Armatimonadetes bacterium]|nr:isoleucine--tRNA ligase [Armatimonadota bacterium]
GSTHRIVLESRHELSWPADVYLEGSDQHRGWFNSSLMVAVATKGAAPYRIVITHGFVVDEEGRAMHKSLGNVVSPFEVIDRYGADVLRLWVCSSSYFEDVRLGSDILKRLVDAYFRFRNSLRFALGNLHDFNPDADRVPYEQLMELDRYMLHRLQCVIADVTKHFNRFEFYRAFQLLQRFCATELSAFYFDVLKDRLYVMPANSIERRSAQTVLFEITATLCRILFPMISHTAEEAWQHLPHWDGKPESVALASWAQPKDEWMDERLASRYEQLLRVRDDVHRALEQAKRQERVTNPLEAKVELYAPAEVITFLQSFSTPLTELFIVSATALHKMDGSAPEDAIPGEEVPGLHIRITLAPGDKCARCWQRRESVGCDSNFPDLCARCASVVRALEAM